MVGENLSTIREKYLEPNLTENEKKTFKVTVGTKTVYLHMRQRSETKMFAKNMEKKVVGKKEVTCKTRKRKKKFF